MYQQLSDADLMHLVGEGNHQAFTEIVTRHTDRFFALAYRMLQSRADAQDVVQAAFIKLWQKPRVWRSDKSAFTTWFYRVIVNACHDHRRCTKIHVDIDGQQASSQINSDVSEQHRLENSQDQAWRAQCVERAISRLPDSQRDALNLVVYGELPQKQAAELLGVSLKALESLLIRAKKSMAKTVIMLQNEHPEHLMEKKLYRSKV